MTGAALAILILGSVFSVRWFNGLYRKYHRRLEYIKPVMLNKIVRPINAGVAGISFYDWEEDRAVMRYLQVGYGVILIPKKYKSGSIIYMLTSEPDPDYKKTFRVAFAAFDDNNNG